MVTQCFNGKGEKEWGEVQKWTDTYLYAADPDVREAFAPPTTYEAGRRHLRELDASKRNSRLLDDASGRGERVGRTVGTDPSAVGQDVTPLRPARSCPGLACSPARPGGSLT